MDKPIAKHGGGGDTAIGSHHARPAQPIGDDCAPLVTTGQGAYQQQTMPGDVLPGFYSLEAAARLLGLKPATLKDYAHRRKIGYTPTGRGPVFAMSDIAGYLHANRKEARR